MNPDHCRNETNRYLFHNDLFEEKKKLFHFCFLSTLINRSRPIFHKKALKQTRDTVATICAAHVEIFFFKPYEKYIVGSMAVVNHVLFIEP